MTANASPRADIYSRVTDKIVADLEQTLAERQVELAKAIERIKEMEKLAAGGARG